MDRASEYAQEQQEIENLSGADDYDVWQYDNLSGLNGEAYFTSQPLQPEAQE